MANKIQFKRGLKTNLPSSADVGMPLWCTDTQELYIGTGNGVALVGGSSGSSTPVDTYTKSEIDSMFSDIEILLSEV
ncbi:hypothetical protein J6O48_13160 [bacterium]|nr:hypothetical protein [bacterium]